MAAAIQSSTILPDQGMERLILVSGLGTVHHLHLSVADSANRQENIDKTLKLLDDNDAALTAYAATHGLPAPVPATGNEVAPGASK